MTLFPMRFQMILTEGFLRKAVVFLDETEQIDIYVPATGDNDLTVTYVDDGRKTTSIYDSSKLETKDQYEVFLGGDTSVADIRTVSTDSDRLLVVKDSFADCFIQFLTPFYREIVVVDPRYCTETLDELRIHTALQMCLYCTVEIHFLQTIISVECLQVSNRIQEEFIQKKEPVRLNKYLSEAGVCSRREADRLIESGKVTVDGQPARTGMRILPARWLK